MQEEKQTDEKFPKQFFCIISRRSLLELLIQFWNFVWLKTSNFRRSHFNFFWWNFHWNLLHSTKSLASRTSKYHQNKPHSDAIVKSIQRSVKFIFNYVGIMLRSFSLFFDESVYFSNYFIYHSHHDFILHSSDDERVLHNIIMHQTSQALAELVDMRIAIYDFNDIFIHTVQSTSEWNPLGKCIFSHPARYLLSSSRFHLYVVKLVFFHYSSLFIPISFSSVCFAFSNFHVAGCMSEKMLKQLWKHKHEKAYPLLIFLFENCEGRRKLLF